MSHRGTLSTRYKKEIKSKELFFLCFLLMVVFFFLCVLFGFRGGSDPFLRWQPGNLFLLAIFEKSRDLNMSKPRSIQRNETEVEIQKLNINSDDAEVCMLLLGSVEYKDQTSVVCFLLFFFNGGFRK